MGVFTPVSGYNKSKWATARFTLQPATAVTASYVNSFDQTGGDYVDVVGYDYVVLSFTYVTGAETTIRVKPMGYNGTDWVDLLYKAAQGSAVSELTKDVYQITKANFTTGDKFGTAQISVSGYQRFATAIQGTSGSTFGTMAIYANGGINDSKE